MHGEYKDQSKRMIICRYKNSVILTQALVKTIFFGKTTNEEVPVPISTLY